MLDVIWLLPAVPLAGFVLLVLFGRRMGQPLAGWVGTAACATSFVLAVVAWVEMLGPAVRGAVGRQRPLRVDARRRVAGRHGVPRRPAVDRHGALRHRRRRAHPPLLDRLHARGPEVLQVLRVPEPVPVLDAHARPGLEHGRHVPRLGGRGRLLLPPRVLLAHPRARRRSPGRRRSSPPGSATWGSCWPCSSPSRRWARSTSASSTGPRTSGCSRSSTANGIAALLFLGAVGKSAQLPLYLWLPGRHGGPHPGLRPHPRRDHGDGRCVPHGAREPRAGRGDGRAGRASPSSASPPRSSRPPSRWPRTTSRRCSPTPP